MSIGFTSYVTAQTIRAELSGAEGRAHAVQQLRTAGFTAVILESYRGGLVIPEEELGVLRDFFQAHGFETLGGLMPVHGPGFGKPAHGAELRSPFFCYSDEATVALLELEFRKLARLFDQVVIDDAFLTPCRCSVCNAARADRDWGAFRRVLLTRVAERWIDAVREENPRAVFTVKFPQYYDRYHRFGYDAESFPRLFDRVWVGTETRNPDTLDYGYVEPYEGYFNVRWMRACAGDKFEGAWFDYLDCDERLFVDQAVCTCLAAPSRVTVFCYHRALFDSEKIARLAGASAGLEKLREAARNPEGVYVVKPPNSDGDGDLFAFDYFGMLGIPCVPATELRATMRSVIVTTHSASDPRTPEAIRWILETGGQVVLSAEALRRLEHDAELLALFGYDASGIGPTGSWASTFECGGKTHVAIAPVRIAADLAPADAEVLAWAVVTGCEAGAIRVPLATLRTHAGGGRAVVWNLGTFGHGDFLIEESLNVPVRTTLFHLPMETVNLLRNIALAPLGYTIHAPARVASFLFAEHASFVNFGEAEAEVRVSGLSWQEESLLSDSPNTHGTNETLRLAPHSFALVRRME